MNKAEENADVENVAQALREFYRTYYETPPANRFGALIEAGHSAFPELFEGLAAPDGDVRTDALRAIGAIFERVGSTPTGVDNLLAHGRTLKGDFGPERQAVLYAIGVCGDRDLIAQFAHLFASGQSEPIKVAAIVWGHARYREAEAALCEALSKGPMECIAETVWALGRIGGELAEAHCIALLEQDCAAGFAIGALGDMGSVEAIAPLIDEVRHPAPERRLLAIHALAVIAGQHRNDRRARMRLRDGLDSFQAAVEEEFRPIAVRALELVALLGGKVSEDVARHALGMPRRSQRTTRAAGFILRRAREAEHSTSANLPQD